MRFGNRTPIEIVDDDDYYDATVPLRASYEPSAGQLDDEHFGGQPVATAPTPHRTTRRQRLASRHESRASVTSPTPIARSVARRWSGASTRHVAAALALLAVIVLGLHSFDRQTQCPPRAGSIPNEVATNPSPAASTAARAAKPSRASPVRRRPLRRGRPNVQGNSRARQHRRPLGRPAAPSLSRPSAVGRSPSSHHAAPASPAASPTEVEFGLGRY